MEQLKVGEVTLTWLNGGVTHMDGGAMFGVVPKPLWSKKYPHNELNQIELRTDPILVQVSGENILIESGIGNRRFSDKQKRNFGITEEASIHESLAKLDLTTKDIDKVLMTHMHFDHASGLAKWYDDKLVPAFENATIYTSEVEWNECKNPNIRSRNTYWEQNWKPIEHQVVTYRDQLEVLSGIHMYHTGGHSDGHSIITIEANGETLIHMADLMPTHAHQNPLWVLAYDDYPMTSIAAKEKWANIGREKQAWYIFYHDAKYRALKWDENLEVVEAVLRERK